MYDEKREFYENTKYWQTPIERGPWKVFAIIGLITSIFAISFAVISIFSVYSIDYDRLFHDISNYQNNPTAASKVLFEYLVAPIYTMSFSFSTAIPGLIFSILGKKSKINRIKAVVGSVLSPISLALLFIAYLILISLLGLA